MPIKSLLAQYPHDIWFILFMLFLTDLLWSGDGCTTRSEVIRVFVCGLSLRPSPCVWISAGFKHLSLAWVAGVLYDAVTTCLRQCVRERAHNTYRGQPLAVPAVRKMVVPPRANNPRTIRRRVGPAVQPTLRSTSTSCAGRGVDTTPSTERKQSANNRRNVSERGSEKLPPSCRMTNACTTS